ncbi:MAG: hypothetical protein CM1200mP1_12100 [Candidatus Neomarinimicrobiota bacterium]|nr:MAG: hypothetical protein CM1200mP1_12100 [Candidatus Neomarinimicrobiota bacterium]
MGIFFSIYWFGHFCVLFGIILDFIINRPLKGEPVFSIIMATKSLAIILRSLTAMLAGL